MHPAYWMRDTSGASQRCKEKMHEELIFEPALLVKPRLWNQFEVLSNPSSLKKTTKLLFFCFRLTLNSIER